MQKILDGYGAGVQVTQVQLQKVDPPAQVIDAFRDVQAARADQERLQNEAKPTPTASSPKRAARPSASSRRRKAIATRWWPRPRARPTASLKVYRAIQERARRDPPAHLPRDHGEGARRHRQGDRGREGRIRRGAVSAAVGVHQPGPAGRPPRRASNEPHRSHRRPDHPRHRRGRGLSHAVHRRPDPAGAGARIRQAEARDQRTLGSTTRSRSSRTSSTSTSASSTSTPRRRR